MPNGSAAGKELSGPLAGLKSMLRSLKHRNYRLFFGGQGISVIGTWIQSVALGWLVTRSTNDPLMLGLVGFSGQIIPFILTPFAGVLADRWNKRRLLVLTQSLAMVQALMLAVLTLTGVIGGIHDAQSSHLGIYLIVSLSAFMGLVNAVDIPVRQSFVVEMVGHKEDLPNAIALNSFMFNGARLVGPALAILVIVLAEQFKFANGEGLCFLLNGLSYIAVIASLLAMRIPPKPAVKSNKQVLQFLKEGFSYSFGQPPIRSILLLLGAIGFIGMPYTVLVSFIAYKVLCQGGDLYPLNCLGQVILTMRNSTVYYSLISASGLGALVAAMFLASRKSVRGLSRVLAWAPIMFGSGLVAFSLSAMAGSFVASAACMAMIGFAMMTHMASSNTILQTIVDDDKRGRVMSFYAMAFMGTSSFGNLVVGGLAKRFGSPMILILCGAVCIACGIIFATRLPNLRKHINPIYIRLGIITPTPPMPLEACGVPVQLRPGDK
jgi:MFS family permease